MFKTFIANKKSVTEKGYVESIKKGKKKRLLYRKRFDFQSVGVTGFEPVTPCSQSRCANRTALHPEMHFLKCGCKGMTFY